MRAGISTLDVFEQDGSGELALARGERLRESHCRLWIVTKVPDWDFSTVLSSISLGRRVKAVV
jgi:hypothetical protein